MAEQSRPWLGGDIERALETIDVPCAVLDRSGVDSWDNTKALELFGDLRGRDFAATAAPDARQQARVDTTRVLLGARVTASFKTVMQLRTGERVPAEIHLAGLTKDSHLVGIFGFANLENVERSHEVAEDDPLTPRQRDVLAALASGASTQQIAEALTLSETTVRNHVKGLLKALGVHSRLEAVVEAQRRKLVR